MSDTTITAEERAEWRERLTSKFSCFDAELSGFTLRLLNVLEITEGMLDGSVQETRANFSAVYQACTEIIPELKTKLAESEARAEKAEANVARLRDALQTAESALSLAHHRGQYDLVDKALSKVCTALYGNKGVDIEAARRDVADSEVKP